MKRLYILGAILLWACVQVRAALDVRSVHMTTADGLPSNSCRSIMQDSKGYIWLGTLGGLCRYDGRTFVALRPNPADGLSLPDQRVGGIVEDADGLLWISTIGKSYSCYDLRQDRFVDFTGCGQANRSFHSYMRDSLGRTWLCEDAGVCRRVTFADGKFTSVEFSRSAGTLFSDRAVFAYQDCRRRVWIGCADGVALVRGDKAYARLRSYSAFDAASYGDNTWFVSNDAQLAVSRGGGAAKRAGRLGSSPVNTVYGTMQLGKRWFVFTTDGGFTVDLATGQTRLSTTLNVPCAQVKQDNRGNFYLYNHSGTVWYVDRRTGAVSSFRLIPPAQVGFIDEERFNVVSDRRGLLWISTYGNGLFVCDPHGGIVRHFTADIDGFSHLSSNYVQALAADRDGGIWLATEYTGISHLTVTNDGAERFFPEDRSLTDRSNTVRMVRPAGNGLFYLANRTGCLYTYSLAEGRIVSRRQFPGNVYAALSGPDGQMWYATRGKGLCVGDHWYSYDRQDAASLAHDHVFTLFRDRRSRVWVGTFGGGLCLAVRQGAGYAFRRFFTQDYGHRRIRSIESDSYGRLWVGTNAGITVFDPDELAADSSKHMDFSPASGHLRSWDIKAVYRDSRGRMWISEPGSGFAVCQPQKDLDKLTFKHYCEADGLVSAGVHTFIEDSGHCLWIATDYGLSRFDPDRETFANYFFATNILGNTYSENCAAAAPDGRLLFGTNHGLTIVSPQRLRPAAGGGRAPTFTNLWVNGVVALPGEDSPLGRALAYSDEIRLSHTQNSIAVDFTTFDYSPSASVKYSYRLEGYDRSWSVPSADGTAAYKRLPAGTYRLRVRVCGPQSDGAAAESVLTIVVEPPFWLTWWAFAVYLLLVAAALYAAFRVARRINDLRNRVKVEKRLTEFKLQFFTNISHEFRTPLTLIQGSLEKLGGSSAPQSAALASSLSVMRKSTARMMRLIDQLLEFRKMQAGKLALRLEETDVMSFLLSIAQTFVDAAESKGVAFRTRTSRPSFRMPADRGYLDKIAYNLLSNAFKYTPKGGTVEFAVVADDETRSLTLTVSDTGVGIPEAKRKELFQRFMQSSFSGSSMGVGLNLTHELVRVHHGSITYAPRSGGGSVFTVVLPADRSVYQPSDFLSEPAATASPSEADLPPLQPSAAEEPAAPLNTRRVLIIEDDDDVRELVRQEIAPYFDVAAEPDGRAGLERARDWQPDLVVCDVMMPVIDGIEVTRRLKSDFDTSHIPVILLTALTADDSRLKGIECGADAYITKPFHSRYLIARIAKLIEQRDRLRRKFASTPAVPVSAVCTTDRDREFADRLERVLEQRYADPQFSVDDFAAAMSLGRTAFYKKVRGLTGSSPNEYIRTMRMKKAAELLADGHHTVAEAAYAVGMNDPYYFSKCFKAQFGVSPSQVKS